MITAEITLMKYFKRFNAIDLLLLSYVIVTFCFIFVFYQRILDANLHLLFRVAFMVLIFSLPLFDKFLKIPIAQFFRIAYPLIFISFFYSETDAFNNVFFQNLDYHFARFDSILFGFQPSLAFYNSFPYKWFSELMNFSYFSYYFLIAIFSIYIFINDKSSFVKIIFYITCSFLIYYITFIIIPVSGPQYFFEPPHNQIPDSGIFRWLVKWVEMIGERPTAAFPSSHVGIVLILIIIALPKYLKTWYWLVPFFILLSLSTVYVKAHYAIDVIGGIISAPVVLWLSKNLFILFKKKNLKTAYATIDC